jgi:hypothetical protein
MAHRLGGRERLQLCIGGEEAANTTQPAATCRPRKCRRGATEAHPLGADPASKRKQRMISACLRLADPDLSSSWTSWRRRARTKRPSGTSIPSRAVAKGVQPRLLRLLRRVAMTAQKSQADVLLHRLHYALPGQDAGAEGCDAHGDFHSAALRARAWAEGDFDADHGLGLNVDTFEHLPRFAKDNTASGERCESVAEKRSKQRTTAYTRLLAHAKDA